MGTSLDDAALDVIFRAARTQNKWLAEPVLDEQIHALYDLLRWGPTSANCFPLRIVSSSRRRQRSASTPWSSRATRRRWRRRR